MLTRRQFLVSSAAGALAATTSPSARLVSARTQPPRLEDTIPLARNPVRLAVIGDYGAWTPGSDDVAWLVKSWDPACILTLGDNNYPNGAPETIDDHIGRQYHSFIGAYRGRYGAGADQNRFFPALGNHDWYGSTLAPYLGYFDLPGNGRYYSATWGPVALFAVNSDWREPDGISSTSLQAQWLRAELAASPAPWKLVYMHTPPFSSGYWGSTAPMQWPYQEWGADAVLAGHDHLYERLVRDGVPYFVNGLGGQSIYPFREPIEGSAIRFNQDFGAMLVEADESQLVFRFVTRAGTVVDEYSLEKRHG